MPPRGRKATVRRAIIGQSFNFLYWRERGRVYQRGGTGVCVNKRTYMYVSDVSVADIQRPRASRLPYARGELDFSRESSVSCVDFASTGRSAVIELTRLFSGIMYTDISRPAAYTTPGASNCLEPSLTRGRRVDRGGKGIRVVANERVTEREAGWDGSSSEKDRDSQCR